MGETTVPAEPSRLEFGETPVGFRSGFVSIVGRPNVGKSTLLNQMLRRKVAITSDRPQTTRNAIRGILTTPRAQFVFVDTPGLHKPRSALGRRLNRVVRNTLAEVDLVLFVVDVADGIGRGDAFITDELGRLKTPVLAVLNKVDRVPSGELDVARKRVAELGSWDSFAVSARTGVGVAELVAAAEQRLPEGPLFYPPDAVTDQPTERIVAELIREKVLERTHEEVPHSVAVSVEEMTPGSGKSLDIAATIFVERDSQKGIVIGRGGSMLKEIGMDARREIEALLDTHVYLDLRVKVERDWQRRDAAVARFGYGE